MLSDFVHSYVEKGNCVITSSSNNGCTSLAIYIANILCRHNKVVMYYNPTAEIDRCFVKKFYKGAFENCIWLNGTTEKLVEALNAFEFKVHHLILDPADALLTNANLVPMLSSAVRGKLICTSQIRLDPKTKWAPYSTLEKKYMGSVFNYSIWLRNVTEDSMFLTKKYVDVFKGKRVGNRYSARYIAKFTKDGNIIE